MKMGTKTLGVGLLVLLLSATALAQDDGGGIQLEPAGGEINPRQVITISFPTAMIAADKIDTAGMAAPIAMDPPVEGKFLWKSVTEGEFTMPAALLPGQTYRVRLAPGLRDAGGRVVNGKISETFNTPAFRAQSEVEESKRLRARPQVLLEFNYAVDLSDAAERIYFQDRDSFQRFPAEIALRTIDRNDPDQPESSVLRVSPREDLPPGRTFDLILDGVRAQVGGKPLPFLQRFALGTTQPLKVEWLGAFNAPRETPLIRAKFNEELVPESVSPAGVTVEPALSKMKVRTERDEIVVEGDFDARQRYRVTIAKGVRGVSGFVLAADSRWGATFQPKPSAIFFPGPLIHERSSAGLNFAFVQTNTGAVKWKLAALPIEKFAEVEKRLREFEESRKDPVTGQAMIDPKTDLPLGKETEVFVDAFGLPAVAGGDFPATGDGPEAETLRTIQWSPAAGAPVLAGLYLLEVTAPAKSGGAIVGHRSIICFSDAILTQKRGGGVITLRVARMGDAAPLPGAKVRLVSRQNFNLADGVTNADGIVTFPMTAPKKFGDKERGQLFIADTAVGLAIQNYDAPRFGSAYDSRPDPPAGDQLRSVAFSDRNLYRPGETVKFKGIARIADGVGAIRAIPAGAAVEWRISTEYQNDRLATGTTTVSPEGGWEAEWAIPAGIKLGGYRLTCYVAGALGSFVEFRVQEFRIPIFEVMAQPVDSPEPSNKSVLRVSSRFFSGQPNGGAKVHWKATWNRGDYFANDDFHLDDQSSEQAVPDVDGGGSNEGDAVLDREGNAVLTSEVPKNLPGLRFSVDWKVTVTSLDGQTIQPNRIQSPVVMLQPQLLGLRMKEADPRPDQKRALQVEVQAFDRGLQVTKFPGKADVEIFHITTKVAKEKVAPFVFRYRNSPQFNPVAKVAVTVPGTVEVSFEKTGRYVAVVSAPGLKPASASEVFGGAGADEVPVRDDSSLEVIEPGKLAITPQFESKDQKNVGTKARLIVRSPFTGAAWVTLEADGAILDTLNVPIDGNSGLVDLPIKPEYSPNAFATVYLVKPGGAKDLPAERFGVADFRVRRPDQELEISPRFDAPSARPGERVAGVVEVKSEGRAVENADLTIFAVDDAILELGEWKAPELGAGMRPPRGHGVATYLALNEFIAGINPKSLYQKGFTIGGGGEDEGRYVRKDFKALVLWRTGVKTDAQGRAKFEFMAPDNLTRFRLVAVGQTRANQFGVGAQTVEIAKPLIAEPSLPRFLREGDEVDLRVVTRLGSADARPGTVAVTATVDSALQLTGPATVTADVSKEKSAAFSFRARVAPNATSAKISFAAKTAGQPDQADEVEVTLPVFPRVLPRREALAGSLAANSAEWNPATALAPDWRKPGVRGRYDVLISTSPYLPQLNALPAILSFPHGCFEQITTKVLAHTLLADLLKSLPPMAVSKQASREAVEEALQLYAKNILANGQLPYWPVAESGDISAGNPFVTISAAWAVQQATALGYTVPDGLADRLAQATTTLLRAAGPASFQRAYAAYVLSQASGSAVTNADLLALHRERDKLGDEGRALLALAMHYRKTLPTEKLQLLRELGDFTPKARAFDPRTFSSPDRAFAICLLAMNEIAPPFWTTEKRGAASQRLLKTLDELNLGSTQENLWSLLAFRTIARSTPGGAALAKLKAPRTRAAIPQMSPDSTAAFWPGRDLASPAPIPLAEMAPSNAALRYLVTAEYTPPAGLSDNDRRDRGFRLERVVKNLTDAKRDGSAGAPYQLNDRLLITYRIVSAKQNYFVALEDELPAGLETINPDLKMLADLFDVPEPKTWLDLSHVERRDRKTVLYFDQLPTGSSSYSVLARVSTGGAFRWPASTVAPMYDLRSSGQSPASDIVIAGDR